MKKVKKDVKKTGKMSCFKRLTLGNMICNYGAILCVILVMCSPLVSEFMMGMYIAPFFLFVAIVLAIAQAVEGRHYGDVWGKLTRRNVTMMFTIFLIAGAFFAIVAVAGYYMMTIDGAEGWVNIAGKIMAYVGAIITAMSVLAHTVVSTIIVAKAK